MYMTKLQEYAKLQALVQKEARAIAEQVYDEKAAKYGVAKVPLHRHNGFDSPQVRIQDIAGIVGTSGRITMATDNQRYYIGLNSAPGVGVTPSSVRLNGIAVYSESTFTISSSTIGAGAVYTVEGLSFTVLTGISPGTSLVTAGPGGALTSTSGTLTKLSGSGPSTVNFSNVSVSNLIRSLVVGDAFIGNSFYNQPDTDSTVVVGGDPQVVVQSSSNIVVNDSGSGPATQALSSEGHIVSITFNGVTVARATIPDLGDFGANEEPIQSGRLAVDVELEAGWSIIASWQVA